MKIIESIISTISPGWALKRAHASKVLRSFQGAEANRLTANRQPRNQAADQELLGPYGADAVRKWSRALVRDNPYAWNIVDTIVSNVVGDGITAQSVFETNDGEDVEDINDRRDKIFAEWCEVCDINGQLTFAEMQILAKREIVEAGEVIIRLVRTPSKTYKGITRPVPLALEIIEADRIALEKDTFASRLARADGNRIIRGVELDDQGMPVAYWLYPEHPNSPYSIRNQTPERIPARDVLHLFRKDRAGQSRGVSWFAPSMTPIRDLGVYMENELQSSAVASCFGVVVKTNSPAGSLAFDGDQTDANGNTLTHLEPGMVTNLAPGEDLEVINPGRPNSNAEPWINLILRSICAGTGTNYEAIAKDFSKTSYSSSRSSKLEDRPRYRRHQNYIINHLCMPVWDAFCDAAALAEVDGFPTSTELLDDRRAVAPVEWQRPEQPWVDPQSEQASAELALKSFTDTYQAVCGGKGLSYRSVFYQRAKEEKLRLKLGLLTPEEQTAQMMAAQTGATTQADQVQAEEQGGSGEWMGLSRLQWIRNRKALTDVLNGLSDGSMSAALATAQLSMIGLSQKNIDAIIADASDGVVDQPVPEEEASNA